MLHHPEYELQLAKLHQARLREEAEAIRLARQVKTPTAPIVESRTPRSVMRLLSLGTRLWQRRRPRGEECLDVQVAK